MEQVICNPVHREPWNKGKLVGQKAPLKLKDIIGLPFCFALASNNQYIGCQRASSPRISIATSGVLASGLVG